MIEIVDNSSEETTTCIGISLSAASLVKLLAGDSITIHNDEDNLTVRISCPLGKIGMEDLKVIV